MAPLSDADRQRLLLDAGIRASLAARRLAETVDGLTLPARMARLQGTVVAQRFDPTGRVSGHRTVRDDTGRPVPAISDPTGEAAIGRVDRARTDLKNLDWALGQLDKAMARIEQIITPYLPAQIRQTMGDDDGGIQPDPLCESCARYVQNGVPHRSPIKLGMKSRTQVKIGGEPILNEPLFLCTWCYDKVRAWHRLPEPEEIARYVKTGKVFEPKDNARR